MTHQTHLAMEILWCLFPFVKVGCLKLLALHLLLCWKTCTVHVVVTECATLYMYFQEWCRAAAFLGRDPVPHAGPEQGQVLRGQALLRRQWNETSHQRLHSAGLLSLDGIWDADPLLCHSVSPVWVNLKLKQSLHLLKVQFIYYTCEFVCLLLFRVWFICTRFYL